jgi:plastocyanin
MTDTMTPDEPQQTTEVEPASSVAVEAPPAAAPVRFWDRPYVEKFLTPIVLPVCAILGVVIYVLNVSRLFLAGHGHIPVIAGTVVTVLILLGAASLAAAPRLRNSSVVMLTAGFIGLLAFSGWMSLGASEGEGDVTGPLPADLKTEQTVKVTAGPNGQLVFVPDSLPLKTGLVKFEVTFASGGHTFGFHDPTVRAAELMGDGTQTTVGFFAGPGQYEYFCAPHEAQGMKGEAEVTGDPITLEAALQASGNPPDAAGGGE